MSTAENGANTESTPEQGAEQEHPNAGPPLLALGSDSLIYVAEEDVPEHKRKGRAVVRMIALTPEETSRAADEIAKMAFNASVAAFSTRH